MPEFEYFDIADDAPPMEQLLGAALNDVIRTIRIQSTLYEQPLDAYAMIVTITQPGVESYPPGQRPGRVRSVTGIAWPTGEPPRELILSRRELRPDLERVILLTEMPGGLYPHAQLYTFRESDGAFNFEQALDANAAAQWDTETRGIAAVADLIDPRRG